jgi:hypothetical protein
LTWEASLKPSRTLPFVAKSAPCGADTQQHVSAPLPSTRTALKVHRTVDTTVINATEYRNVSLSLLNESTTNPYRTFEDAALKEPADSIRS